VTRALAIPALAVSAAAIAAPPGRLHFTDATAKSGLDMVMTSGRGLPTQILEVKGGGLALLDYDRDGDLDLFVPNGAYLDAPQAGPGARLFANDGRLRFRDVTREAGIDFHGWGMGVAVGDVDGNGFDDVYVAAFGPDVLLLGDGRRFVDATERAGLGDPAWGAAAAFGDVDADGDLDLYVANYLEFDPRRPPARRTFRGRPVFGGPSGLAGAPDRLYENLGEGGFRDISVPSGIAAATPSYGLGVVMLDFDDDGKQDVFVGNDSMPSFLWMNRGGLRFTDRALEAGLALNGDGEAQATMGIAVGDVNADGRPDVFTTNFSDDTNTLRVSLPGLALAYDDRTRQYNLGAVSRTFLGWATGFFDFDHDADEDIVVFNGHVYPDATLETMNSTWRQTPLLFERRGARFERVAADTAGAWLGEAHVDRSAAFGDLDGDGDVDVVVAELNGPVRVLENDGAGGHFLLVELEQEGVGNARGLGSRVVLRQGDTTQTRWVLSGGSFQAASLSQAHFGLASDREVDLEVFWPDGARQAVARVPVDRRFVVRRGNRIAVTREPAERRSPAVVPIPSVNRRRR
jgi:enediyne biosynthesis protein E4